jgi:hypothetical protein
MGRDRGFLTRQFRNWWAISQLHAIDQLATLLSSLAVIAPKFLGETWVNFAQNHDMFMARSAVGNAKNGGKPPILTPVVSLTS